ncbi:MAG TPA: hypothetical protein PLI01_00290 [Nitrospira sp.]|nr:hypothetical protein [Nitrospira sp.]HNA25197.1 hypothetical protein [Nitrospira sp.]
MPTTWGNIKEEQMDAFRDVTKSYIGDSELLRMLRRVLRMIGRGQAYTFQQKETVLTLTGAQQYDLETLLPRWCRIISITNPVSQDAAVPLEMDYMDIKNFALTVDRFAYSIIGNRYLRVFSPTQSPLSGSLRIIWCTSDLCVDGTTNETKALPTSDNDYFLIPERFMETVIEGLNKLSFRKDRSNRADQTDSEKAFNDALAEMQLMETIQVDAPVRDMQGAW